MLAVRSVHRSDDAIAIESQRRWSTVVGPLWWENALDTMGAMAIALKPGDQLA
jgi:hypothetical protein